MKNIYILNAITLFCKAFLQGFFGFPENAFRNFSSAVPDCNYQPLIRLNAASNG